MHFRINVENYKRKKRISSDLEMKFINRGVTIRFFFLGESVACKLYVHLKRNYFYKPRFTFWYAKFMMASIIY